MDLKSFKQIMNKLGFTYSISFDESNCGNADKFVSCIIKAEKISYLSKSEVLDKICVDYSSEAECIDHAFELSASHVLDELFDKLRGWIG